METERGGSTVGVVGTPDVVGDALESAGVTVVTGEASSVASASPDWFVATGEAALVDLVAAGVDGPVLPVDAGRGVQSVPPKRAGGAVASVAAGDAGTGDRRLVAVDVDGDPVCRALLDVLLVTDEPAHISEYAVRAGDDEVSQFRADGVVVATPAGSVGYAADAGGPALYPGTGALGVVPVAPFVTDAHHWVVRDDRVAVTVEREEPTALVVDGRRRRLAPAGGTVTVAADGRLEVLLAPESPPVHGGELEKH